MGAGGVISSPEDWDGSRKDTRARIIASRAERSAFMCLEATKTSVVQCNSNPVRRSRHDMDRLAWSVCIPVLAFFLGCFFSAHVNCEAQSQSDRSTYKRTILAIQEKIESGDLEEARTLVANAARSYPHDGGIENLLGVIEIEQGHTAAATKAFSDAIAHSPRLATAYLNLSRIKMETAATDPAARSQALQLSMKVIQLEPANDEAHYQAATVLFWNKEYRSSLEHVQQLSPQARTKITAQALLCAGFAATGNREKTTEAAAAMENNPDLTEQDAETCLAGLRFARRADLIESIYSAAATHQALSPSGLRILGLSQEAEGKFDVARATLESAFAANQQSIEILQDIARVAQAAGDNQGALGYLAHARDLRPANASLAYQFAAVCLRMGLLAEARKALAEALRLDPDNANYNLGMGIVVSFSADPSQAMPYLARYHSLRPNDPRGVLELGAASYRAKDYETATHWLRLALSNRTTAPDAHFYLGRIARQEGQLDAATVELKQALALRPDQPDTLAELGQICLQTRKFDQASAYFDQALRMDPDNYGANFGLLQLYARTGDSRRDQQTHRFERIKGMKQEQEKQMMRVIEIRPDDPLHGPN
jgi:tetratricopeptide (TPR) repeat protein